MTSKQIQHEYQKNTFLKIGWQLDEEVKLALWQIVQNSTPSDTLRSRFFSLAAPIKKILDPAVSSWLDRNGYEATWIFSDLLKGKIPDAISSLQELARQGNADDWFCGDEFSRTCDTLIEFLYFCGDHPSHHIPVVKLEPKKRDSIDSFTSSVGRGTAIGSRANKSASLPPYLISTYNILKNKNLCTACGEPTLAAEERERQVLLATDASIKKLLNDGTQFYSKYRGSLEVCGEHSEKLSGSNAAKHGRRWRESFLSLLFVMKFRGVSSEMNSLFSPSFEITFARMAIQNKACHSHIKKIASAIPHLIADGKIQHKNAVSQIVNDIKLIFLNLKLVEKPYDPSTDLAGITLGVHNGVTLLNANAFGIYHWQQTSPYIAPPTLRSA